MVVEDNNKDAQFDVGKPKHYKLSMVGGTESGISIGHDVTDETSQEGNVVSDLSRSELQALLKANKAEVDAVASEMRREMAAWREQSSNQLSQLTIAINALSSKVDGKVDSLDGVVKSIDGKFEGVKGQIEGINISITGINTALSGIQSGISTRLTIFAILMAIIVALPGIISLSKTELPTTTQPVIIQVPSAITTPAPTSITPPESSQAPTLKNQHKQQNNGNR